MGEEFLESRPTEKDLVILADEKLNISQHCVLTAWKANGMVGFIRRVASTEKEVIISLSCPCEAPSGEMHPCPGSSAQGKYEAFGDGQMARATFL